MIVKEPFWSPELPIPATARPTMNITEDWETAHSSEPTSKMKKKKRNTHFALTWEYTLPVRGWRVALDNTHQ